MKRLLSPLLVLSFLVQLAAADDQTRNMQGELKKEGFYFGEVDGNAGPEFGAALRRYQIRNGLEVTGQPNEETLGSLGITGGGASAAAAPKAAPTRPAPAVNPKPTAPAERPRVDLRREEQVVESDRRALREVERNAPERSVPERNYTPPPRDRSIVPPPADFDRPYPQGDYRYREIFEGSPYVSAPRPLQEQTLRAAQKSLARSGFYDGELDGVPGPETTDGILDYQRDRRLRPTGRLDIETLAELRLLPGVGSENPSLRPFTRPGRSAERRTYRGVWVR